FNKPHIVGIHGLGNKFSVNPDKAVKFDFDLKEHSFKKKVTKLSDGKVIEISRLYEKHAEELELKEKTKKIEDPIITEIGTDLKEIKDLKQTKEVANAELGLKENIDDVQEDYDINIDGSLFEQIPGYLEDITTVSYAKYFEKYDVEKRIRVKNEPDLELKENKYTPVDDSYSHAGNIN
ncbi:MAG: hypothetical protein N3A69_18620, partial [Leptospiraceae bacterium]|nr:hypothetical protein [Leptospiraceae bacterium]